MFGSILFDEAKNVDNEPVRISDCMFGNCGTEILAQIRTKWTIIIKMDITFWHTNKHDH
ncbi:hypothetical protein EG68_06863 [Paragonimus skrjabini miyazakii]|uniref:Uncharacterized protein n=1 Tax=Paragonimus skrjabini miyazakii TaxID=59628 RepID=A0A8S9YMN9_9TREM|nr:hypothetical protein EG68_06863 [Paragonimus skrjabini miyazakii]